MKHEPRHPADAGVLFFLQLFMWIGYLLPTCRPYLKLRSEVGRLPVRGLDRQIAMLDLVFWLVLTSGKAEKCQQIALIWTQAVSAGFLHDKHEFWTRRQF